MKWSKTDLNHIRTSLDRCKIQGLANELGAAKTKVRDKVREIELKEHIRRLARKTLK